MRAGVGSADITPEPGMILQGHWSTKPSHSVMYPIEARAVAFEDGGHRSAIITLDLIGIPLDITKRIREAVAKWIPADSLMVACSHTHCAPPTLPCLGMIPDPEYMQRLVDTSAQCVQQAIGELQEVTVGLGCGATHFNISRRPLPGTDSMVANYGMLVDRRVRVLRIEGADRTLAVLFHYACHPTTFNGSNGFISPDYPGIARTYVERELGCKALYLPGCFGNIRPAILTDTGGFTSATREQLDACGEALGREVCRVSNWLAPRETSGLSARVRDVAMPYGEPMAREQLEAWAIEDSDRGRLLTGPWAKYVLGLLDAGGIPKSRATEMQRLTIGPIGLVSIPGEPVQEIGHAIEKELRDVLGVEDLWPIGYANDEIGYLCTVLQYGEGGYEPNAYPYYGDPAPYTGEERVILESARALCQ
jgi:neutral ceramidase